MIRATELDGRTVIDMDAAEKLGRIEKIIIDPDARRVAAFVVGRGGSVFGNGAATSVVPAAAVHAIGPDAVTVRHGAGTMDVPPLEGLPHAGDLIGRKVVSTDGRFVGVIDDVLISEENGRVLGYQLADGDPMSKIGKMFGDRGQEGQAMFLRADADLRAGRDLIVAPEEAVAPWTGSADAAVPRHSADAAVPPPSPESHRFRHATSWFQGDSADADRALEDPLR